MATLSLPHPYPKASKCPEVGTLDLAAFGWMIDDRPYLSLPVPTLSLLNIGMIREKGVYRECIHDLYETGPKVGPGRDRKQSSCFSQHTQLSLPCVVFDSVPTLFRK